MEKTQLEKVWKTYSRIQLGTGCGGYRNGYQHLLFLMNKYGFMTLTKEDFDLMCQWDQEELDAIDEEEKYYNEVMMPETTKVCAQWREEEKDEFKECRIRFLKEEIKKMEDWFMAYDEATKRYAKKYDLVTRVALDELIWNGSMVDDKRKKLKRFKSELDFRSNDNIIKAGGVTEEQVSQAKQYPFTQLIQFDRRGFVKCPYHNERTASCSLNKKDNTIHCFGCGVTKDTIDYVMDQHQKSFIDAVKQLCNI